MNLWSLGLSAHEIAIEIAEGSLEGQIFFSLLKFARLPRERKVANGLPSHDATTLGGLGIVLSSNAEPALNFVGIKLEDLKYDHCRWPIGDPQDPSFHFCGEQKGDKSRYCAVHHKIAYRPVETLEIDDYGV